MTGNTSPTWDELARTYRRYRELPVWTGTPRPPNNQGLLSREDIRHMRDAGAQAAEHVDRALDRLRKDPAFPRRPREFQQATMDRIVKDHALSGPALADFWSALIFDRDGYACRYCGRSVWEVWESEGRRRSLWLLVDPVRPRTRIGGGHELDNSLTACWACSTIKAGLPPLDPFLDELRSLARAVSARYPESGALRSDATG